MSSSYLTADSELLSTCHDRERREERQIAKITLQEARRYGMAERQHKGRIRYTYAGHVFIYDPKTKRAITSWKIDPNWHNVKHGNAGAIAQNKHNKSKKQKEPKSGTRFQRPIMIQNSADHASAEMQLSHLEITREVRGQKDKWTSHTVLVVDMSGSMREDDVDGARCRSDGVWTTLARDFVKQQLESKKCSLFDIISVVTMQQTAKVVIECEPMDWVVYNKLVSYREWDNLKPHGHGFYRPALAKAEELLNTNGSGICSLSLMLFSDGKPSDFFDEKKDFSYEDYIKTNQELVDCFGQIGARFGRRLNIMCIGIADKDENFRTLENMANEANMFGALAQFNRPSLNTESLSQIINSSVASSLATKTELTSLKTGKARAVRTDIQRERSNAPEDRHVNENWRVFSSESQDMYTMRVWTWNSKGNDFANVIDPRCRRCYKNVADSKYHVPANKGIQCPGCQGCFFCFRCAMTGAHRSHRNSSECEEFNRQRREGFLVGGRTCPLAHDVAWKKKAFGEGAERLAFKFRFLDEDQNFVGPVMVAKESRFVEDFDDTNKSYLRSHRHLYHKTFMRTQATAATFARKFNEAMQMEIGDMAAAMLVLLPRVEFVEPLIFELEDTTKGISYNVLTEPFIGGKYKKFTDNFGNRAEDIKLDFSTQHSGLDLAVAASLLGREVEHSTAIPQASRAGLADLGFILEEGSEEDDDSDSEDDYEEVQNQKSQYQMIKGIMTKLSDMAFLQAFSHFTFVRSGGRIMVVDLQGAVQNEGGQKTYLLTDPAIHHRRNRRESSRQFGRTDLGGKGVRAFFESHKCNDICKLFQFREKNTKHDLDGFYKQRNETETIPL